MALTKSCQEGYLDIVNYLIFEEKVDIKKMNELGNSILLACSEGEKLEIIEYLIHKVDNE